MAAPNKTPKYTTASCCAMAAIILAAGGCNAPQPSQADNRDKTPPAREALGAKETNRAPVQPVPAESRTPEEAAKRAADPKDPSGALIIESAKPVR